LFQGEISIKTVVLDTRGAFQVQSFPQPQFLSEAELLGFLEDMSGEDWISHVAYLDFSSAPDTHGPYAASNYPAAWIDHYLSNNYFDLDPVVRSGLSGLLPFDWRAVADPTSPKHRAFFGEAAEFGVATKGLSIPIRGINGERALLSINSDLSDRDWARKTSECLGDLFLFAHQLHLAVRQWRGAGSNSAVRLLTPRERDVLLWAAEGKTNWETAQILDLSEPTVAFYVKKAMAKLGSTSKTQAVAVALRNKLI
jgi:DNA-binding CsgD family transcriptional regulator